MTDNEAMAEAARYDRLAAEAERQTMQAMPPDYYRRRAAELRAATKCSKPSA